MITLLKVSLLDMDVTMSRYFDQISQNTVEVSHQLGSALEQLASGDLTVMLSEFPEEYEKVENDFNVAIASLNATISSVVAGVGATTTGASEIRFASDDLARRTEEQAANLEETAAAVAQTTARLQDSAQTAGKARETIQLATAMADDGTKIVAQAVTAMDEIDKSSSEINNIIAVIESIAFQTNLRARKRALATYPRKAAHAGWVLSVDTAHSRKRSSGPGGIGHSIRRL